MLPNPLTHDQKFLSHFYLITGQVIYRFDTIYRDIELFPYFPQRILFLRNPYGEDRQLIFYTEEDPDSGAKTRCRLEVHDRKLVIMRTGVTTNQMELVIGKTTSTKYHTPFGLLEFDVTTDTLQIKQSENELKILACYTLASEGAVVSKHTLHIKLLNA